eukprot:m.118473 g.118473  ORF g.118473 m.118473 type:complete len:52 (-) comp15564_c0_seq1:2401-2556(-)
MFVLFGFVAKLVSQDRLQASRIDVASAYIKACSCRLQEDEWAMAHVPLGYM